MQAGYAIAYLDESIFAMTPHIICDKINSIKFLAFIKRLRKHHKKRCIVVDNARWHLTKKVMSFIKENRIKIIRLLAYSPELNPIDQYWKNIKNWLAIRIWSDLPELKKQLCSALKRNFLIPNIYGY